MEHEGYRQLPLVLLTEGSPSSPQVSAESLSPLNYEPIPTDEKNCSYIISPKAIIYVPTKQGLYTRVTLMDAITACKLNNKKAGNLPAFRTVQPTTVYKGEHNRYWTLSEGTTIGVYPSNAKKVPYASPLLTK